MDRSLRKNTHFWRTFMTRGQHKCIVSAQNKGSEEETIYISPEDLDKTYQENGIATNCVITLFEFRGNILD